MENVARHAAAAFLVAAIVGACGTPAPTPTESPSAGPTPTPAASTTTTAVLSTPTPTTSPPTQTAALSLGSTPEVPFAGDTVTLTIDAYLDGSTTSQIASATVDFGDGSSGTTSDSCTANPTIDHAYSAGDYQPKVISATACEVATAADLTDATTPIYVLPAAPPASATWPTCTTFQLRMTGEFVGAAAGNVEARIVLQNDSAAACKLEGYPSLQLVASDGRFLPTTSKAAPGGAYTFPPVIPHLVALAPEGYASFQVAYADNPSGPESNEPYSVACPASKWARVILPGTHEYGTAAVAIGACGGDVSVSPIVPGRNGFNF